MHFFLTFYVFIFVVLVKNFVVGAKFRSLRKFAECEFSHCNSALSHCALFCHLVKYIIIIIIIIIIYYIYIYEKNFDFQKSYKKNKKTFSQKKLFILFYFILFLKKKKKS